jgi:hypothetical protein
MKKSIFFTAALGMMLLPCVNFAQVTGNQPEPAKQRVPREIKVVVAPAPGAVVPTDQQPTNDQLPKLFELMRIKEQMESVTKMMPAMMQQQFQAQFKEMQKDHPEMAVMTEEQQQAAAKVMGKFMGKVMDLYTSDEAMADMAGIYQRHLTSSDVDGMIAFYSSPAGQHMVDMAPVIMREYMPMVMQKMQERMKPMMDEMKKEMEEIAKPQAPSAK